jgi:hypothetical protein
VGFRCINGTKHSPFSRIKNLWADITHEEARAKGYIKGTFKKEEWFALAKRVTTPSTIYKKQKLDRDDIIDITDLDVVAWLKGEMRLMLDEELARAVLIGDGRAVDDEDKIKDPAGASEGAGIRSIANDDDLYAATITLPFDHDWQQPAGCRSMRFFGTMRSTRGRVSRRSTRRFPKLTWLLLARDGMGRRLYRTASDLAAELGVSGIVPLRSWKMSHDHWYHRESEGLHDRCRSWRRCRFFDDFDIDYNQYKYLIETRVSGALTKIRSALVLRLLMLVIRLLLRRLRHSMVRLSPSPTSWRCLPSCRHQRSCERGGFAVRGCAWFFADDLPLQPDATHYFENNVEDEWTFTNDRLMKVGSMARFYGRVGYGESAETAPGVHETSS